ncbi:MAG: small multi-drug export protein [Candidatus Magasanikbacteria bacterium]|nr:small multi-drug export protein [Candidatus Magasanikbacteria bacterium]
MLNLNPATWFLSMPPEVAIFLLSMIPITELRASIPIGIEVYNLAIWKVWVIAVVGDTVPAIFILLLMPYAHKLAVKYRIFGKFLTYELEKAEKKFSGKYEKYGSLALIIFVGIPLPFTGSWTGSLASFVFNIPFRKSFPLILIGVCVAATIVTFLTLFAGGILRWFI